YDQYVETDEVVAAIALTHGDQLLLALRDRLALLDPWSGQTETLRHIDLGYADTRLNDGKCDAQGRFWVGSASQRSGEAALFRYDPDGSLHVMERGLTISNGLGWSPDGRTFYLTDSPTRKIYAYRFDPEAGSISDRRVLVDLDQEAAEPDGLTVDRAGHL